MSDDDCLVGALREFCGDLIVNDDFPKSRERIREAADRLEQLSTEIERRKLDWIAAQHSEIDKIEEVSRSNEIITRLRASNAELLAACEAFKARYENELIDARSLFEDVAELVDKAIIQAITKDAPS